MFVVLHRAYKLAVLGLIAAGVWAVWAHREKARPAVDYYQLWAACDYRVPDPMPVMTGRVERVLGETSIQVLGPDDRKWNIGLAGVTGVPPEQGQRSAAARRFAKETISGLDRSLRGREVVLAVVLTNVTRTGLAFPYLTNGLVHLDLVASGRLALDPAAARVLPLGDQYALRLADRAARRRGLGLWAEGGPGSDTDSKAPASDAGSGEVVHDDP